MAKNLIIGGFTNYEINQLKPWVLSAMEVAGDNDVVLVVGNTSEETLKWLVNQGVIPVPMAQAQGVPIHVLRFISIYEYLKNNNYNTFYSASISKLITTSLFYPFDVIRTLQRNNQTKQKHWRSLIIISIINRDQCWGQLLDV